MIILSVMLNAVFACGPDLKEADRGLVHDYPIAHLSSLKSEHFMTI